MKFLHTLLISKLLCPKLLFTRFFLLLSDAYIIIWRNDRKEPEEENWTVEKSLRKHLGDVTDLSWSADSNYLLSASIDSTAVLWDVKKVIAKRAIR